MLPLAKIIADNNPQVQIQQLVDSLTQFMDELCLSHTRSRSYMHWILRFSKFHNYLHPVNLSANDIETYLSSLASEGSYDPKTQDDACKALRFLYQRFLKIPLAPLNYYQIKNRRGFEQRFGYQQCQQVINQLKGSSRLMAELAMLGKLKLSQVVALKLTDINMKQNRLIVRTTDGQVKFMLSIPLKLIIDLRIQIMRVKQQLKSFASFKNGGQWLFPLLNNDSLQSSSPEMQLIFLKNELKFAISQIRNNPNRQTRRARQPLYPILPRLMRTSSPARIDKAHQTTSNISTTQNNTQTALDLVSCIKQDKTLAAHRSLSSQLNLSRGAA